MSEQVDDASKAEARSRFLELERQGQQFADQEGKKFAIFRHATLIYKLARLDEMSYQERVDIVKRIRPRQRRMENDDSKVHDRREDRSPTVVATARCDASDCGRRLE